MADEYTLGHNVSSADRASGVVGVTQLPPTVLPTEDTGAAPQQQFSVPVQRGVDSESLINMAIQRKSELQQQRQGLTNQRSQLISQLSHTPMGRKGHLTPQALAIQSQIKGLDRQEHGLDFQDKFVDFETDHRMSAAYKNAATAEKFATSNLAHQTAEQAGEVFLKGTEIMGKYKPGTQEFQDEMAKLKDQYPLGFASEAVKGHFGQIAKFHDQEMEKNTKSLQTQLFKETNLSPDQFVSATNIRATNAPVGSNLGEIEKQRADKGASIAFDVDGQTVLMKKSLFNNLSKTFRQPQPTQASVAVAQPNADADAQSRGFRDATQLEQFRTTGKVVQPTGQQVVAQPASTPATLDANTASAILQEAGGDKDKARALAKQRGYAF
jgi:hypothetical protein